MKKINAWLGLALLVVLVVAPAYFKNYGIHLFTTWLVFIIATLLVWALFVFAYYATHWPHHARALVGERLWQLALDGVDFMERMMKIDPKVLDAWASGYRGEASLEGVPEEMKNVARQTHAQRVQRAKQFGVEL